MTTHDGHTHDAASGGSSAALPASASAAPTAGAPTSGGACPSCRDEILEGMSCVDTSSNKNIPVLMEMVGAISRATDPQQVLRDFAAGLLQLEGPRGFISISTRGLRPGQYKITRLLVGDEIVNLADVDPWATWDTLPIYEGGFIGELIRQAYPEILHNVFLKNDSVLGDTITRYGSLMAVPLFENGEPINWAFMLREDATGYTERDMEESILRSNLVGTTVRNVMAMQQLQEAHDSIRKEMDQIARIQRALLPRELPDIPGVTLGTHYEVFDTAGGDIYDFAPVRSRHEDAAANPETPWLILIADAAGHGPSAATIVAMLNAILYAAPEEMDSPAEQLSFANKHLVAKGFEGTFVTALLARYCPKERKLTYARAGHPPPVLMLPVETGSVAAGGGGSVNGQTMTTGRLDAVGGVPLGVLDEVAYDEAVVHLEPGQSIVFYTDGITESLSPAGRMYGVSGIEACLTECSGEPDCAITHITKSLLVHEAGLRPNDDQTIVVMQVGE